MFSLHLEHRGRDDARLTIYGTHSGIFFGVTHGQCVNLSFMPERLVMVGTHARVQTQDLCEVGNDADLYIIAGQYNEY